MVRRACSRGIKSTCVWLRYLKPEVSLLVGSHGCQAMVLHTEVLWWGLGEILTLINMSMRRSTPLVPSVKQSSGSSRSSASSGIFLRISSGSGQSTVLPSEELVSSTP